MSDYTVNVGRMPPNYSVVYSSDTEHYHWVLDEIWSEVFCDRFDARQAAWADYKKAMKVSE